MIEAMKQALEALEILHPLTCHNIITSLRQAIEQAEKQEHHAKDCALLQIPSRDCDCVPTTQREWVDLTPTDIADALGPCPKYFSEWTDADVIYFARTLDAKLKDKNT